MIEVLLYFLIVVLVLLAFSTIALTYAILTMKTGEANDSKTLEAINEFYELKAKGEKEQQNHIKFWEDFKEVPESTERKYNPDEITGALDGMFSAPQAPTATKENNV